MNNTFLKFASFIVVVSVFSGCTSVKLEAVNNTDQQVIVKVQKYDNNRISETNEIEKSIVVGGKLEAELGSYLFGTKLRTLVYLRKGGMLNQSTDPVNWKPDPFTITIIAPTIALPTFSPQEPGTLLARLTGDLGDLPMSGRLDSNLDGYLGAIYINGSNGYERRIGPDRLNKALKAAGVIRRVNDRPNESAATTFTDFTQNNEDSFKKLHAKLPQVFSGELKVDFTTSNAYKHKLEVENMGWYPSAVTSDDLKSYLKQSEYGQAILKEIEELISQYDKAYYMDSVYLLDKMDIKTYESNSLDIDADIHAANFVDASGAYSWKEAKDKGTTIKNAILGSRYIPMDLVGKKLILQNPEVVSEPPKKVEENGSGSITAQ
jgi:hypothetical protein